MDSKSQEIRQISLEEVAAHNTKESQWIIFKDKVYDISSFYKRHPGGRLISYYAGQDASEAIQAFHPNAQQFERYLKSVPLVGQVHPISGANPPQPKNDLQVSTQLIQDFRQLRAEFEKEGLFRSNKLFYIAHLIQIVILEVLSLYIMAHWPDQRWAFWTTSVLLAISQAQAGWLQHDFGHLSVFFQNKKLNQWVHYFVIGGLKGASSRWWNSRHNRHHAKTNIIKQDPDIHTDPLFVFGEEMVKKGFGNKYLKYQSIYWWFVGPPITTTIFFVYDNLYFVITYKKWADLFWMLFFFTKFAVSYSFFLPWYNVLSLYFVMRFWESHWFTWVTSMNHLPNEILADKARGDLQNWVTLNVFGTQNISRGFLHNWFTGHLNHQIEHHLFPTMPRHNYPKVAPRVQQLCEKYGLPYIVKPMHEACMDIIHKLSRVGNSWDKYHSKPKAKVQAE